MAGSVVTVAEIAQGIENVYPASASASWDNVGLLVGDPAQTVEGIVFALDPTLAALEFATAKAANVVVTHHPVFLSPLQNVNTSQSYNAHVVHEAIKRGIALINAHTNLDVSRDAKYILGSKLGLLDRGDLETKEPLSYAEVWEVSTPRSLAEVARRCREVFGVHPRVWGEPTKQVIRIVTATGSASSRVDEAIAAHADLLIAGEIHYHECLAATEQGLACIELGHDVSEWPLVPLLKEAVLSNTFISPTKVYDMPAGAHWWVSIGE